MWNAQFNWDTFIISLIIWENLKILFINLSLFFWKNKNKNKNQRQWSQRSLATSQFYMLSLYIYAAPLFLLLRVSSPMKAVVPFLS